MHLHCRIGMQNSRIHEPNLQPISRGETGCNRRKRIRITCLPYAPKRKATFCEFHIRLLERKFLCSTIKFTVRLLSAKKVSDQKSTQETRVASRWDIRWLEAKKMRHPRHYKNQNSHCVTQPHANKNCHCISWSTSAERPKNTHCQSMRRIHDDKTRFVLNITFLWTH